MRKYIMTLAATLCCAITMAVFTACSDTLDNPVIPENPETPEQQAFWAQFDSWQTDSCTLGDDFYMHTIGTWWKNPVDIYPKGLLSFSSYLNEKRVSAIYNSNPNLLHLKANAKESINTTMSEEEVEQIINEKVEELWAGATTREEALEALGRALAEGYTLEFEPAVELLDGNPCWIFGIKLPSYINESDVNKNKELIWRALAQRKKVSSKRRVPSAENDYELIFKGMNIDAGEIQISDDILEIVPYILATQWSTVEGIRDYIEYSVWLIDGTLVNDDCVDLYNDYLADMLSFLGITQEITLTRKDILKDVEDYMANIYALNDYNQQFISQHARQQYADMCEKFREAMRQRLEANTWLEDETRQKALKKIDKMMFYVGGIDVIPDCVIPTLTGNNIIEDVRQLRKARMDGYRWAATQSRSTVAALLENLLYIKDKVVDNAYYVNYYNIVTINPSNLLAPYVHDDYEDALQWAFLATTIGHEITHGFDSDGSQYDEWGNLENWWTDADAVKFKTLCDQLADQYNHLQLMPWADPTLYGDGQQTLDENTADLGGCCLGLHILLDQHPNATDAEKQALTRRYFQGWAIQWSDNYNLDFAKKMKGLDVHSLARERTNGVVRNMDAWYEAYNINSGTLYLKPSERVHIW